MNENYIVITESMLQLGLKPIEVMLLAKIKSYKNGCFASIENISKELNVGYSTIQRALKTLLNKGLIVADKKTKYNTIKYTVVETPTENKQESKQDNKQDEQKEEKTVNTTPNEENTLENAINIIENKNDYPMCKDLIIKYINYMYEKHNKIFTANEIEDLYNDSQILSEKELEKAINTAISKGYNTIKFACFKQERKKNKFDNFEQRQYNRCDFYELENSFFN